MKHRWTHGFDMAGSLIIRCANCNYSFNGDFPPAGRKPRCFNLLARLERQRKKKEARSKE